MRVALAALLVASTLGCSGSGRTPQIERVEMKLSGWSGLEVEVNSEGKGRYHLSGTKPNGRSGSFFVSPQQFRALIEQLEPFRRHAVPLTENSAREVIEAECPTGKLFVTDAGGFWVHWIGPNLDHHYAADFGCDGERNAARNEALLNIMRSLPVPAEP